jgi:hypothetical protein
MDDIPDWVIASLGVIAALIVAAAYVAGCARGFRDGWLARSEQSPARPDTPEGG